MPRVEDYNYQHPWETPEPHLNPGYTGYLPGYGPKRIYQMAKTYGKMTHNLMKSDPKAGYRLAPILDHSENQMKTYSEESKVFDRELSTSDLKLRNGLLSSYAGYVPRKLYRYGKSQVPECREAVAEFTDFQKKSPSLEPAFQLPDQSLLMKEPDVPAVRPYALNENTVVPKHADPRQKVDYGDRPLKMSSLNPDKKHIPGYTGYIPGKPFHFEMTYGCATNSGLEEMSRSLQEYNILRERPSVGDWYVGRAMKEPEKAKLDGYHLPMVKKCGPVAGAFQRKAFQGYGGYIPRYAHKVGVVYGDSAKCFYNHEDLTHSVEMSCT